MLAVVDPNVLVSALISTGGPPRQIVSAWVEGRFDLLVSPELLTELGDVLARPKFRRWVSAAAAPTSSRASKAPRWSSKTRLRSRGTRRTPMTTTSSPWRAQAKPIMWSPVTAT